MAYAEIEGLWVYMGIEKVPGAFFTPGLRSFVQILKVGNWRGSYKNSCKDWL